ncbi:Cytochrome c [Aspergillus niger]|uniref:Cytochrome c n=1 Tax=Aspergillus niger TaxID=5061 RepID=A0A505I7Q1_ASPNG|nr:Cytochrome c [Aspergillus niger]
MTAGMISSWRLARSQQLSREKRPLTAHSVVTMQGRSAASGDGSKGE